MNTLTKNNFSVTFVSDSIGDKLLSISIYSLLVNNTDIELFINIFTPYDSILNYTIKVLDNLKARYKIYHIEIGKFDFVSKGSGHIPKTTWLKFLIPRYLESSYTLYLDYDVLVVKSIRNLLLTDISRNSIGAVRASLIGRDSNYFNSGVMLMNLDFLRLKFDDRNVKETLKTFKGDINNPFLEQDILNVIVGDTVIHVDEIYNSYPNRRNMRRSPVILHFYGPDKPLTTYFPFGTKEFIRYYNEIYEMNLYFSILDKLKKWILVYYGPLKNQILLVLKKILIVLGLDNYIRKLFKKLEGIRNV